MPAFRLAAAAAVALATAACGDDDRPSISDAGTSTPTDAATDSGSAPTDGGPDSGTSSSCPPGICDLLTNGCPSGQGCYFLSPAGEPVPPPIPLCQPTGIGSNGSPCTNYTDCAPGLFCELGASGTSGRCIHYCCGDSDDSCPDGEVCAVTIVGPDGRDTGVGSCARLGCRLIDQDCPGTDGCYLQPDGQSLICTNSEMSIAEGGVCSNVNDCTPGLLCVDPTSTSTLRCHRICDTSAGSPTAAGCEATQTCSTLGVIAQPNAGTCVD